jgi:hypothetical protein
MTFFVIGVIRYVLTGKDDEDFACIWVAPLFKINDFLEDKIKKEATNEL